MHERLACPCCGAQVRTDREAPASFPFCSRRCRLRDLGRWLDGGHAIPGEPIGASADAGDELP